MFELENNKELLYQWDTNILVKVNNEAVTQVHFSNGTTEAALVVNVVDGLAPIPNILLQEAWNIRAYAFCDNCTMQEKVFEVVARKKPADYVYTETEVVSFAKLEERMNQLEATVTVEGVSKAVEDYLKENPIEAGATDGGGDGYGYTYDNVYRAITYCYLPLISDKLFRFSHVENRTTSGGNQIMKVDNTYTIGGDVSKLEVYNQNNEKVKHYNYYLYLYYEEA